MMTEPGVVQMRTCDIAVPAPMSAAVLVERDDDLVGRSHDGCVVVPLPSTSLRPVATKSRCAVNVAGRGPRVTVASRRDHPVAGQFGRCDRSRDVRRRRDGLAERAPTSAYVPQLAAPVRGAVVDPLELLRRDVVAGRARRRAVRRGPVERRTCRSPCRRPTSWSTVAAGIQPPAKAELEFSVSALKLAKTPWMVPVAKSRPMASATAEAAAARMRAFRLTVTPARPARGRARSRTG